MGCLIFLCPKPHLLQSASPDSSFEPLEEVAAVLVVDQPVVALDLEATKIQHQDVGVLEHLRQLTGILSLIAVDDTILVRVHCKEALAYVRALWSRQPIFTGSCEDGPNEAPAIESSAFNDKGVSNRLLLQELFWDVIDALIRCRDRWMPILSANQGRPYRCSDEKGIGVGVQMHGVAPFFEFVTLS